MDEKVKDKRTKVRIDQHDHVTLNKDNNCDAQESVFKYHSIVLIIIIPSWQSKFLASASYMQLVKL